MHSITLLVLLLAVLAVHVAAVSDGSSELDLTARKLSARMAIRGAAIEQRDKPANVPGKGANK